MKPIEAIESLIVKSVFYSNRESNGRFPGPGGLIKNLPENHEIRVALRGLSSVDVSKNCSLLAYCGLGRGAGSTQHVGRFNVEIRRCSIPGCKLIRPPLSLRYHDDGTCGRHSTRR